METLVAYFIPSLMILFVPIVLAVYTVGCVFEHGSYEKASPIILLNVILAVSIAVVIVDKQVSTLLTMAMVSYGFIAFLVAAMMVSLLMVKMWARISPRLPIRLAAVRSDQAAYPQSYSQ